MSVVTRLKQLGGIARTTEVVTSGSSRYHVGQAVRSGEVDRPRRGWLALPDTDTELLEAAKTGVVLTCVTQARRLELWVPEEPDHSHVAAPHPRSRVGSQKGVVHWGRPLVERKPHALVDPIENVLGLVVACQPRSDALAVIDSALNKGLVTLPALEALPISRCMRELLRESSPYADSGLETYFRIRLKWLRVPIRAQVWVLGHRVDFLVGQRLVVQIDGGHHVGAQRTSDIRHDANLTMAEYHVLRFSYEQVMHRWEEVQAAIMNALARGLHESG